MRLLTAVATVVLALPSLGAENTSIRLPVSPSFWSRLEKHTRADVAIDKDWRILETGTKRYEVNLPLKKDWAEYENLGSGTLGFCDHERTYQVNASTFVKSAVLTLQKDGTIDISLLIQDTSLAFKGYMKGNHACVWIGGGATCEMKQILVDVSLKDDPRNAPYPRVDVRRLVVEGFKLRNVHVEIPFLSWIAGDARDWVNEMVEKKANSYIAKFLSSEGSNKLEDKLTEIVKNFIDGQVDGLGSLDGRATPIGEIR
jgi:hypothetical protein